MRAALLSACLLTGLAVAPQAHAADKPTVTAKCKDGTDFSGTSRQGACSRHGGVASFTGDPAPLASRVWFNTDSKVYHCKGDPAFGKTKEGKYVTEAEAREDGGKIRAGKPCT